MSLETGSQLGARAHRSGGSVPHDEWDAQISWRARRLRLKAREARCAGRKVLLKDHSGPSIVVLGREPFNRVLIRPQQYDAAATNRVAGWPDF